jgi:hypothetical protein
VEYFSLVTKSGFELAQRPPQNPVNKYYAMRFDILSAREAQKRSDT